LADGDIDTEQAEQFTPFFGFVDSFIVRPPEFLHTAIWRILEVVLVLPGSNNGGADGIRLDAALAPVPLRTERQSFRNRFLPSVVLLDQENVAMHRPGASWSGNIRPAATTMMYTTGAPLRRGQRLSPLGDYLIQDHGGDKVVGKGHTVEAIHMPTCCPRVRDHRCGGSPAAHREIAGHPEPP